MGAGAPRGGGFYAVESLVRRAAETPLAPVPEQAASDSRALIQPAWGAKRSRAKPEPREVASRALSAT